MLGSIAGPMICGGICESLVMVQEVDPQDPQSTAGITAEAFLSLGEEGSSFADIAGYLTDGFALQTDDDIRVLDGAMVTPNVFDLLNMRPLRGRTLEPDSVEEVVLSEMAWKR